MLPREIEWYGSHCVQRNLRSFVVDTLRREREHHKRVALPAPNFDATLSRKQHRMEEEKPWEPASVLSARGTTFRPACWKLARAPMSCFISFAKMRCTSGRLPSAIASLF